MGTKNSKGKRNQTQYSVKNDTNTTNSVKVSNPPTGTLRRRRKEKKHVHFELPDPSVVEEDEAGENYFDTLPIELKVKIFQYLSAGEVCRVSTVCKAWSKLCRHQDVWFCQFMKKEWTIPGWSGNAAEVHWRSAYKRKALWWKEQSPQRTLLTGHGTRVSVTCLAVYGETLVTGSTDKTVRLWSMTSGLCREVLVGHKKAVYAIDITKNTVVSGGGDSAIRVWDAASGDCLHIMDGHEKGKPILSLIVRKDFNIVSASEDGSVRCWKSTTGNELMVLFRADEEADICTHLYFSEYDGEIITCHRGGIVRVWEAMSWDVTTWGCIQTLDHGAQLGCALMVGPALMVNGLPWKNEEGGVECYLCAYDRILELRDEDGLVYQLERSLDSSCCIWSDRQMIAFASNKRTLSIVQISTGKCLHVIDIPFDVGCVAGDPNTATIIVGGTPDPNQECKVLLLHFDHTRVPKLK